MADDLDTEWWRESDDSLEESEGESSGQKTSPRRGVKRPAQSEEDDALSDELVQKGPMKKSKPSPAKKNVGKKKKKKTQKSFTRKKITDVDADVLKQGGTPADVQALLTPTIVMSTKEKALAESNDDDEQTLSLCDADFFPANQQQPGGDYLREMLPGWQGAVKEAKLSAGSPLLLILCSSAVRAVQLNRDLKSFLGKDCKTAKLFAKHMKLEEQKAFLKKKVCHASIGTPNRVQALLESGCLKLSQVHAIVLDWNWRDIKLKRMADIPDVRRDLSILLKEHVVEHIRHTPCRIGIL